MISNMPPLGQARIIYRQSSTACAISIVGMILITVMIPSRGRVDSRCSRNPDGSVGFLLKAHGPLSGIGILGRNSRSWQEFIPNQASILKVRFCIAFAEVGGGHLKKSNRASGLQSHQKCRSSESGAMVQRSSP